MDNLFSEGLTLLIFGMGFVFVFLTLLVFATNLMSRLVTKYCPEPVKAPAKPRAPAPVAAQSAGQPSDEVVAVITAAVQHYRSKS